jgi:anti-anti-sigma factor
MQSPTVLPTLPGAYPSFRSDEFGEVTVLTAPGPRLCGRLADRFAREAGDRCRAASVVVVDLSQVTAIDVAGLRTLARLARVCREADGTLRLSDPTRSVRLLLSAAGLYDAIEVFHTRELAILASRIN